MVILALAFAASVPLLLALLSIIERWIQPAEHPPSATSRNRHGRAGAAR